MHRCRPYTAALRAFSTFFRQERGPRGGIDACVSSNGESFCAHEMHYAYADMHAEIIDT